MKLNIGSGSFYTEGWVNVDLYAPDADVKATIYNLPFDDNLFEEAYIGHCLEHLVYECIPEALKEVSRVLLRGSKVTVVGPCMYKAMETHQPDWLLDDIRPTPASAWGTLQGSPKAGLTAPGVQHEWIATTELTLTVMKTVLHEVHEIDIATTLYPATPNRVIDRWQVAAHGIS